MVVPPPPLECRPGDDGWGKRLARMNAEIHAGEYVEVMEPKIGDKSQKGRKKIITPGTDHVGVSSTSRHSLLRDPSLQGPCCWS